MKKIGGFLLLFVGVYLLISLILEISGLVEDVTEATKAEAEDPAGFALGVNIGRVFFALIALGVIFFGFKLVKQANAEATKIKKAEAAKNKPQKASKKKTD